PPSLPPRVRPYCKAHVPAAPSRLQVQGGRSLGSGKARGLGAGSRIGAALWAHLRQTCLPRWRAMAASGPAREKEGIAGTTTQEDAGRLRVSKGWDGMDGDGRKV